MAETMIFEGDAPPSNALVVKEAQEIGAPVQDESLINLLFYGDISTLTKKQQAQYLYSLAKKLGLDPASKPFDIMPAHGGSKLIVYANKGCAAQLQKNRNLDVKVTYAGPLMLGANPVTDIYMVSVDVTSLNDSLDNQRTSSNVGTVAIGGLKGESLANAIMKCHTKAIRRAILVHEGLGFADESEAPSFEGVKTINPPKSNWLSADVETASKEAKDVAQEKMEAIKNGQISGMLPEKSTMLPPAVPPKVKLEKPGAYSKLKQLLDEYPKTITLPIPENPVVFSGAGLGDPAPKVTSYEAPKAIPKVVKKVIS